MNGEIISKNLQHEQGILIPQYLLQLKDIFMSNEAENISRLLHFTEALCDFTDDITKYHDCHFSIEIDDDKFKFGLPELVAEIRKYRQAFLF